MLSVFSTTSILFFTIFLGMALGKTKKFPQGTDKTLINLVFYVALPMHLFLSVYKSSQSSYANLGYIESYVISMLIIIIATYFISKIFFKTNRAASVLNTMAVSQIDGAYFVIPLFVIIFSSEIYAVPLMVVQNIIFFTITVLIIELTHNHNNASSKEKGYAIYFVIKRILTVLTTNPIIIATILGFILGAMKLPLDTHIVKIFNFIGNTSPVIALIALGMSCTHGLSDFKAIKDKIPMVLILSIFKLMLFPVIALIVGRLMGLNHIHLLALVLFAASPTATHNYIIANHYELEAKAQTLIVVLTTIFSFITINLWLYLFQ